ncbi:hypothetical protein [Mycetocola sp. JXN-3]|uniref:hypothetical protein n=1 Tax=Mycetocola sp. JXN-3 TaxID=2116510 RepID=UPI00165D0696|nr:hypothetical protein [Mycetocola sp. JXN-3]
MKSDSVAPESTPFDELAGIILENRQGSRVLVAVDGADPDATRAFADALGAGLRGRGRAAVRVSIDRLVEDTQVADPVDATSGAALYRRRVDYERVRSEILAGFRQRGQLPGDTNVAPEDAVLVVDGAFLLRPELRGSWNVRLWLEGDQTLSEPEFEARRLYVRDQSPRESATLMYDVSDPAIPRPVWGDSC